MAAKNQTKDKATSESASIPTSRRLIGRNGCAEVYHGSFYGFHPEVDMIAVDPPWRQGNLSYWSHRAGVEQRWDTFVREMGHMLARVSHAYMKVGATEMREWISVLESLGFEHIDFWMTTYYAGENAQIIASRERFRAAPRKPEKSVDATFAAVDWARAAGVSATCDPCVGLGKMAKKFLDAGMYVVGVELCEDRAKKALARLCS